MKYYGFNPFIYAVSNDKEGLLYDLLDGDVYQIPAHFVEIFEKNRYTAYESLLHKCKQMEIGEDQLKTFLNDGMKGGMILEFPKPYWRNQVKTPMETGFTSPEKRIPGEFFNVWLQPTGKCDLTCEFCNSYVNCACRTNGDQWSENQLNNLLADLWRYKGMLYNISIHGGNPLLYPHLDTLLTGLEKLEPLAIKLVLPASSSPDSYKTRVQEIRSRADSKVFLSYNVYANHWNTHALIDQLLPHSEINLLLDSSLENEIDEAALKDKSFVVNRQYMLKLDSSNIQWYKEKINEDFFESLEYHTFFIRKHFHKCWGCSFAINSKGDLKPCLWSDQVFSPWKEGEISHLLIGDSEITLFYVDNSLENIETCKDCIYRYGCKECRVTAEFVAGKRMAKNPLCLQG